MKKTIVIITLLLPLFLWGFNIEASYGKGPLYGKNIYPQFLIHLSLPGTPAAIKKPRQITTFANIYYTQSFALFDFEFDEFGYLSEVYRLADYESFVFETGASYALNSKFEFGGQLRIISYYGGFMDGFTQWWHHLFGFPNGGREHSPINDVLIDFRTNNGFNIYLDQPSVGFGDIDLWVKYNIYSNRYVDFAFQGAFKIPTGNLPMVTGSGYPDFAAGLLLDLYPVKYFSAYLQTSFVLPINSILPVQARPYPMFQALIALEVSPIRWFSIITQMNIRTSPITGDYYLYNNLMVNANKLGSVQTNLLVGVVFEFQPVRVQIYFEEDTFTNTGADYTLGISVATNIRTH